ncbi:MAG: hypothetical protein L3K17_10625 [Thermoplasmata archaeon]|nr:hypothetical protein [Thermoplasmata archaeon]
MSEVIAGGIRVVDELSEEEKNELLMRPWARRGPLYQLYSAALMIDYNPTFVTVRGSMYCDNGSHDEPSPPDLLLWAAQNLPSYVMLGWERGIHNEFNTLRKLGMPKEQVMEIVMFSQLYAGMRGLGHVYRAVGDFLPAWGPPTVEMEWPEGWVADPDAFRSGLDLSTREMTSADRQNLESWYERNIGYVPNSILFGLKYHPEFVKVNRAKWEVAIRTLPKQMAPLIMMRMNAVSQNREGLREAALLSKAWGIKRKYLVHLLNGVVHYFAGFEGFYAPAAAIDDVLESME